MTLRIRSVHLAANTAKGPATFDVQFKSGLNLLRADNSSGKSTCLQAIIYALGLEGMMSARRDVPLPHSMTHEVEVGGSSLPVLSSSVRVVIENQQREILSVERVVKNDRLDRALVRTWRGEISVPIETKDYFVRRSGAAQREDGFHFFLARYLGWSLPMVTKTDGSEVPLYLESLFPYFYVEQKHGWSGVQARLPTYLGIRDIGKRSAEFLLALDVYSEYLKKQRLASVAAELERDWRQLTEEMKSSASRFALVVTDLPERIPRTLTPEQIAVQVSVDGKWLSATSQLESLRSELRAQRSAAKPPIEDVAEGDERELGATQARLAEVNAALFAVTESLAQSERHVESLRSRIEDLEEDLRRHKDAELLVRLGSLGATGTATPVCPTCHQEVSDGHDITTHSLTVEQNVVLIEEQLIAFRGMLRDGMRVRDAISARLSALRDEGRQLRHLVRTFRRALEGSPTEAGIAAVARDLMLENQIEQLEAASVLLQTLRRRAYELSALYDENRRSMDGTSGKLSDSDKSKLAELSASLQGQLHSYHLSSVDPNQIELSQDTYRPVHDGFDLGFDLSASDMIRVIWAYLMAMLQVGTRVGNHVGLLILDEPRQQETARRSYEALIKEAARVTGETNVQMIFATSEESTALRQMVPPGPHQIIDLPPGQKLLQLRHLDQ